MQHTRTALEQAEAIVEAAGEAIVVTDLAGLVTLWNPAAARLYGYSAAEMLGRPLAEVIAPERAAELAGILARAGRGEAVGRYATVRRHRDGACVDVSVSAAPIRDAHGAVTGVAWLAHGISERRRAEEEAQEQRQVLESVVENAPIGIALLRGPELRCELANRVFQAYAPGGAMAGRTFAEVWPEAAVQVLPAARHVLETGEPYQAFDVPFAIRRSPSAPLGRAYFAFIAVRVAGVAGRPDALLVLATETTARKQAEDELARARERAEASRAQLQAVLDQMPSGVLIAEAPSGRLMLGNTQAAHIWGGALPRAETVQGYAAYAGYHADGRPYAAEEWPLTRALQGAAVRDEEISIPRPDGTTVTTSQSAAPIRDDQGHIIAAVVVLTDISERRRVEGERERLLAASRRQRRALETTFEADPSGLAVVAGPEARFELINPAYRALTPNPEVDPLGRPFQEVWEAAMGYRTLPLIRRVLASGEPVDIPHYERTFPNGSRHDYSGHLRRLPWNETDAVLVVLWETTALERARSRALQAAEQAERHAAELAATIGAINDGLIIYGPQREVVRINDPALRLLGVGPRWPELSREERTRVTEMRTADGTPLRPGEFVRDRALRGERLAGYRVTIQQPESHERRELLLSAGPIRDREGHILGAVLNLSDVSALVALQEQREDMLRAVSHDLRNPLAGIMGQAQLCERHLAQAGLERERQRAEAIVAGAQRMNTMIQDLVDAARSESGQLQLSRQQVDLRAFLLGLKERLAASLDTARIDVQVAEGLPSVSADRARLERIMTNLWSNALKYSAPGTPVTVSARQEDGLVITSVADRGPGIAPEDLPRLFQRYFRSGTVRERREGVGLGLSITRQLVEAHGGRVWAESQVGIGSTFSFSLPVAES